MIAYTIEGAASVVPLGKDRIRDALEAGDLIAHYHPDSGATLILAEDIREWIRSLPTERRSARPRRGPRSSPRDELS